MKLLELTLPLVAILAFVVPVPAGEVTHSPPTRIIPRICKFGPYWAETDAAEKARDIKQFGAGEVRISCENGGWYVRAVLPEPGHSEFRSDRAAREPGRQLPDPDRVLMPTMKSR